jgi:hypothetical protein
MLRYDACWPWRGQDAAKLEHHARDRRRIVLQSASASLPSTARWASFRWKVVGIGAEP